MDDPLAIFPATTRRSVGGKRMRNLLRSISTLLALATTNEASNLPSGIGPGPRKNEFVNERDGSILLWVPPGTYTRGADPATFRRRWRNQSPSGDPHRTVTGPKACSPR